MIVIPLSSAAYRVHHPKWSFAPTSGAGACAHGGRANRPGVNALYLSLELETALAEYQQLDALMPSGLMVSYNISIAAIAQVLEAPSNHGRFSDRSPCRHRRERVKLFVCSQD
jgi:RES domain-containing protein